MTRSLLLAIALALGVCGRVRVYGFGASGVGSGFAIFFSLFFAADWPWQGRNGERLLRTPPPAASISLSPSLPSLLYGYLGGDIQSK